MRVVDLLFQGDNLHFVYKQEQEEFPSSNHLETNILYSEITVCCNLSEKHPSLCWPQILLFPHSRSQGYLVSSPVFRARGCESKTNSDQNWDFPSQKLRNSLNLEEIRENWEETWEMWQGFHIGNFWWGRGAPAKNCSQSYFSYCGWLDHPILLFKGLKFCLWWVLPTALPIFTIEAI